MFRHRRSAISDFCLLIMVGLGRLELPTSRLSGVRSNRLSYRPRDQGSEVRNQKKPDPWTRRLIPDAWYLNGRDAKAAARAGSQEFRRPKSICTDPKSGVFKANQKSSII